MAVVPISGSAFVCDLSQPVQYTVAGAAGATYQWTATGGTVIAGQGTAQANVQFAAGATSYAVSVVPTSVFGCVGTAVTFPVAFDNPSVQLTAASVEATSNSQITLSFAAPGSANTPTPVQVLRRVAGQGSFAPVGTVPPTATSFTDNGVDAAANSYEYRLELTNGCGVIATSAQAQTIRLVASNTGTSGDEGSAALNWNAYVGFAVQEYRLYRSLDGGSPELLTTVSGATLQAAVPNGSAGSTAGAGFHHEFRVVAVSTDASPLLASSNTSSVDFANAVRSYNVITPNKDGLNDAFVIDNIGFYPGNSLRIFNRWGRQVFQTDNYQNSWGTGADVAPGVYYYLLSLPTGTTVNGLVEVVK